MFVRSAGSLSGALDSTHRVLSLRQRIRAQMIRAPARKSLTREMHPRKEPHSASSDSHTDRTDSRRIHVFSTVERDPFVQGLAL